MQKLNKSTSNKIHSICVNSYEMEVGNSWTNGNTSAG